MLDDSKLIMVGANGGAVTSYGIVSRYQVKGANELVMHTLDNREVPFVKIDPLETFVQQGDYLQLTPE